MSRGLVSQEVWIGGALLGDTDPRVRLNFDPVYGNGSDASVQRVYFDIVPKRSPAHWSLQPFLEERGDGLSPV